MNGYTGVNWSTTTIDIDNDERGVIGDFTTITELATGQKLGLTVHGATAIGPPKTSFISRDS